MTTGKDDTKGKTTRQCIIENDISFSVLCAGELISAVKELNFHRKMNEMLLVHISYLQDQLHSVKSGDAE